MTTQTQDEFFGREPEPVTGNTEETANTGADAGAEAPSAGATLTLANIETLTGLKYVTLQRYAQQYGDRLPHEGDGRNRKYYPEAVEEFRKIKEENQTKRGGRRADTGSVGSGEGNATQSPPVAPPKPRRRNRTRTGRRPVPTPVNMAPPSVAEDSSATALRRARLTIELEVLEKMIGPLVAERDRVKTTLGTLPHV